MIRQQDQMIPMGSNHSHWKGSLIDYADDNIMYRINGTVDVVAIDKVMSLCLRSGLIAHEGKFKALILRTHPYDGTLKPFMLGDKIVQYTSFLVCPKGNNWLKKKKLSWDKDVQTAARSFTALKILMWKEIYKLFRTNFATVYSK